MTLINSFRGKYFFLSNFYEFPVTYNGITYQNNEAAFQAQKCPERAEEFKNLNPSEAKRLGRKVTLRKDWERVKVSIMTDIVRAKFTNPDLAAKLEGTDDCLLEEGNDWGDKIWGTVDGKGQNLLGNILMQVRDEIINHRCNIFTV